MTPRPHRIAWWASYSVLVLLLGLAVGLLLAWLAPDLWPYWIAW